MRQYNENAALHDSLHCVIENPPETKGVHCEVLWAMTCTHRHLRGGVQLIQKQHHCVLRPQTSTSDHYTKIGVPSASCHSMHSHSHHYPPNAHTMLPAHPTSVVPHLGNYALLHLTLAVNKCLRSSCVGATVQTVTN